MIGKTLDVLEFARAPLPSRRLQAIAHSPVARPRVNRLGETQQHQTNSSEVESSTAHTAGMVTYGSVSKVRSYEIATWRLRRRVPEC